MPVTYLQYIDSVRRMQNPAPNMQLLVSGADTYVHRVVGGHIIAAAYSRGLPMFIVDNTTGGGGANDSAGIGGYRVVNVMNGDISLCRELLEVNTLTGISRLRTILADFGFDGVRAVKVVAYINFCKETERRLGNTAPLSPEKLEEYGSNMLVTWKLNQLCESGRITEENRQYLLGRYAEVSSAAADFESVLVLLAPFISGRKPDPSTCVHFPVGAFRADRAMQEMMCSLLASYVKANPEASVLILDDGNGERGFLSDMIRNLPARTEINMLTRDVFSLTEMERNILLNRFPIRIFTRHEDMESCEKLEAHCGDVDVIKHSFTTSVDRRLRANSAWEILLGTNRTDTRTACAPTRDPRFRKEYIQALPPGIGIIDAGGSKAVLSFEA